MPRGNSRGAGKVPKVDHAGTGITRAPEVESRPHNQGIGESQMIVTTMDGIAGRITQETVGVVRGTHLWSRRVITVSYTHLTLPTSDLV